MRIMNTLGCLVLRAFLVVVVADEADVANC